MKAQFLNETDLSTVRMGAELLFQSQVIEAQADEIAKYKDIVRTMQETIDGLKKERNKRNASDNKS